MATRMRRLSLRLLSDMTGGKGGYMQNGQAPPYDTRHACVLHQPCPAAIRCWLHMCSHTRYDFTTFKVTPGVEGKHGENESWACGLGLLGPEEEEDSAAAAGVCHPPALVAACLPAVPVVYLACLLFCRLAALLADGMALLNPRLFSSLPRPRDSKRPVSYVPKQDCIHDAY